jgi:hypothetical protein
MKAATKQKAGKMKGTKEMPAVEPIICDRHFLLCPQTAVDSGTQVRGTILHWRAYEQERPLNFGFHVPGNATGI